MNKSLILLSCGLFAGLLAGTETERIQGEIDRVSAQGGGRVVIGKGVHPCGTLYLKSGVELHLEEGAVLLGGDRPEDYDDAIPPEEVYSYADSHSNTVTRKAFIYAQGATNIAITGKGVIDCQGPRFFDRNSLLWGRFWAKPPCMRPRMVVLMHCRGIRFEDTTFKDSPVWTMWLRHCENIVAARIRVTAEQKMINSDGIDFDACRNIRVGDSYFKTGDDCLILRAIRHDADCGRDVVTENVVVSNCTLNSACQGVRIGCPSDVLIRNAVFRDITFEGNNAIFADQERRYLEPGDRGRLRTRDILFENWTIRCSGCPISASIEEGVTLEDFGHMTFRNITVDSDGPIGICGNGTSLVRDMTLDGISGTIRADPPVVSRRTKDFAVMRKTVSRLAKMPAAESREAERAPYEVSWNGIVLRQQDARISSVPHNRVWPGHQRELSQTEIARFVRFDHEVAGTLEIRGDGVGRLLRHVLPLSEKASVSTEGDDGICIAISRPGAHVVEFDGLPTLHVFADPPLAPVPAPGPGGRLIRFERGEHSPGVVAPRSGDVVVLDEGAVVYGSLFVLNATNVTVTGRGIFDGSRLERSDETMRAFRRAHRLPEIDTESACFAYSVYGSEDVTISGVTFRDPPFWTLVIRNQCRRTLVDNIHIIGNWRYNSDGIDVCASRDTVIRNSFFRTFDDCVIARGPYLKGEYAPVDGMVVTNCSLYCDWGMPFKAQVQDFRGSTIQNVCMRDCRILAMRENGILLAVRYGSDLNVLRNFTFEDLEFDFFPQPYSSLQKTDGEAFVPKPMTYNTLVLSYSYSLGKNLDNQVNGPMEDPGYYHFIYEDLAFRRFKTFGEKRTLDVCLLAKVPRHEYRRVTIEDLPPFKRVGPETVWSNVVSSVEGRTGER